MIIINFTKGSPFCRTQYIIQGNSYYDVDETLRSQFDSNGYILDLQFNNTGCIMVGVQGYPFTWNTIETMEKR